MVQLFPCQRKPNKNKKMQATIPSKFKKANSLYNTLIKMGIPSDKIEVKLDGIDGESPNVEIYLQANKFREWDYGFITFYFSRSEWKAKFNGMRVTEKSSALIYNGIIGSKSEKCDTGKALRMARIQWVDKY